MVSQTDISNFTYYAYNSKTRRGRKKLVADLDSAPKNYPKIVLNLSATKILLNSVIFDTIYDIFDTVRYLRYNT